MKKVLAGILIALTAMLVYRSWGEHRAETALLKESSLLIQQQINNVSKLVVTEGHFSEVYNYADSRALFGPFIRADKKALVVVNAKVTVAYDLGQLQHELDAEKKVLRIAHIPEPEINISPDFEYYDVSADYLNPFDASDYNKIKQNVTASLMKKVERSTLKANAQNRLLSELQQLYVLTNSLGWTLLYEGAEVEEGFPGALLKD
ncbi:DUF4230 domain-containing protein [Maribacter sp. 2307ULW6-5]|uniref:DUF4230 domain-containing protein n=1 Tax=Maribacter sp. 2307ULW6-5 TaxID=3386275 RepID=UPI0039BC8433